MPAKPQQMSDSQEKSDDLIAELAKLMASNASGADSVVKPSVIKLPPLNEATVQATPVRIPGMEPARSDQPRPVSSGSMGSLAPVRIPGMEKPAGISDLPPAPRPASQFDFGRPPAAAPVIQPEPMSNWESREAPKVALSESNPRPATVTQLASMKFDPMPSATSNGAAGPSARLEPKTMPAPASSVPMSSKPSTAPEGDGFNFDFGFGSSGNGAAKQPPAPANDPIADLIAAELDESDEGPIPVSPRPVDTPAPIAVRPAGAAARVAATAVPIKPVSVTPRPAEADRFANAPVFSAKSSAAPIPHISTARAPELDPMDEIESLIGEAVRVEMNPQEKHSAPAPVPPPLNTSFAAPRRVKDEPPMESAEAAILAAAAASGAAVDRVDAPAADDRPYKRMKVKPPKTRGVSSGARQYVGIAVAGTLLLAAGFGLYWVLGMGRDTPENAPVLTADVSPVKVEPAVTANLGVEEQPSGSQVFSEIDGTSSAATDSETLVSRDETEGATVADVTRVVEPVVATDDVSESGLANRKVRTVTVRPDGTIVSGDDAVAGASLLPVDRPDVPEIAGTEPVAVAAAEVATDATETGATEADPLSALVSETAPLEEPAPLEVATAEPVNDTPAVFDGGLEAPLPMPRPFDRSGMVGSGGQTASVEFESEPVPQDIGVNAPASTPLVALTEEAPVAAVQEPVRSTGGGSGPYVQLSSQASESAARASLRETQSRMAGMLNGASLEIRPVDLGARGTWYRVVLPMNSFRDATQTCASIKANGIDCVAIGG